VVPAAGLEPLDYTVLVFYFAGVVGLGFLFRKNPTLADYFLAGRSTHWTLVGISIVATLFSAVSFVAMPGEAYAHGLSLYPRSPMVVLVAPLVIWLFLPFYHRSPIFTVFELLERRFNLAARLIGSGIFLLVRGAYVAVVFYASAKAFQPALGLPMTTIIMLVGVIAVFYTYLGGMRAVIWTDVVQFIILFGGILFVLVRLVLSADGGIGGIYSYATAYERGFDLWATQEFYSFSLYERVTLWSMLAYVLVWNSYTYGVDQLTVQRYLSTSNLKSAVRSTVFQFLLLIPFVACFWFVGTALFHHYGMNPAIAPPATVEEDSILCYYITRELPAGIVGLIFGAILAAVMSTVDSGINSLTTSTIVDFYQRLGRKPRTEAAYVSLSKRWVIIWGVFCVASACFIALVSEKANATIIEVTAIWGNLNAVLLGVFLLAMLTRRFTSGCAYAAFGVGSLVTIYVSTVYFYWRPPEERISFLWIGAIILAATLAAGILVGTLLRLTSRYCRNAT